MSTSSSASSAPSAAPVFPRLLIATRSAHKLREIREIIGDVARIDLVDLNDAGVAPSPEEDDVEAFDSFRENALAKARYFAARARLPTLADDSGIAVDALGGAPGVRSKRFSGRDDLVGQQVDDANNALLLQRLRDVPEEARTAHYVCAAAVVLPGGAGSQPHRSASAVALGTCSGRILSAAVGVGGFGYDPLFFMPTLNATFAQLEPHMKHRVSHRACALRALLPTLGDLLAR